jgi:hypothetical protein
VLLAVKLAFCIDPEGIGRIFFGIWRLLFSIENIIGADVQHACSGKE